MTTPYLINPRSFARQKQIFKVRRICTFHGITLQGTLLDCQLNGLCCITILAGFDSDPNKIGTVINGKNILDMKELPRYIKEYKAHIVILTVPANVAQKITDYAVESGARAIWNFAPIHINVPAYVTSSYRKERRSRC